MDAALAVSPRLRERHHLPGGREDRKGESGPCAPCSGRIMSTSFAAVSMSEGGLSKSRSFRTGAFREWRDEDGPASRMSIIVSMERPPFSPNAIAFADHRGVGGERDKQVHGFGTPPVLQDRRSGFARRSPGRAAACARTLTRYSGGEQRQAGSLRQADATRDLPAKVRDAALRGLCRDGCGCGRRDCRQIAVEMSRTCPVENAVRPAGDRPRESRRS